MNKIIFSQNWGAEIGLLSVQRGYRNKEGTEIHRHRSDGIRNETLRNSDESGYGR